MDLQVITRPGSDYINKAQDVNALTDNNGGGSLTHSGVNVQSVRHVMGSGTSHICTAENFAAHCSLKQTRKVDS